MTKHDLQQRIRFNNEWALKALADGDIEMMRHYEARKHQLQRQLDTCDA